VGLITGLLTLPVAPVRGVLWVAQQITDEVNRQYYGEGAIAKELRRVDDARKSGELDEEEAARREQELIDRRIAAAAGPGAGGGARG
jgi:23S rRNA A2030 N6-methylase RlmJ